MISHLRFRLAASLFTLGAVLPTQPCYAQSSPAAAPATAPTVLPHISIVSYGRGSPVVLIPGLSSPRETWAGIAPALAAKHRVVLVQINGFGDDSPGANLVPGLLDGAVADLHGWMAANGVKQPAVIGHSLGGLMALMLAKAHPDDASRLMIVDALPFIGDLFPPGATPALLAPQAAAMRDRMAAQYGKPRDVAADGAVAASLALTPAARMQVTRWVGRSNPRVSAEALYEDMQTDLKPALPAITAPITLVYPTSAVHPKALVEQAYTRVYAGAPHVTFVEMPDSGHFAMLDQPAAFAAAMDLFLR